MRFAVLASFLAIRTILTTSSQILGTARLPTDTAAVRNAALCSQAVCQLGSGTAQSLNHRSSSAISGRRTENLTLKSPSDISFPGWPQWRRFAGMHSRNFRNFQHRAGNTGSVADGWQT